MPAVAVCAAATGLAVVAAWAIVQARTSWPDSSWVLTSAPDRARPDAAGVWLIGGSVLAWCAGGAAAAFLRLGAPIPIANLARDWCWLVAALAVVAPVLAAAVPSGAQPWTSLAFSLSGLLPGAVVVLAFDRRRSGRKPAPWRTGVTLLALTLSLATVTYLIFGYDPFRDPDCWQSCAANPLSVVDRGGTSKLLPWALTWVVSTGLAVGLVAAAITDILSARRLSIAAVRPLIATAVILSWPWVLGAGPTDRPLAALAAFCGAGLAFVIAQGLTTAGRYQARRRLRELAVAFADGAEFSLPTALGVRSVVFPMPDGRWRDRCGCEQRDPATAERPYALLRRGDQLVAAVEYDPARTSAADVLTMTAPGTVLAFDNARLETEITARLQSLRAARRRVIAAADRQRQRLERDLHDGAQQLLVSLLIDLRLLADRVPAGDRDPVLAAADQTASALAALRDIAHGIHPTVVTEAGLGSALQTLAESSRLPVRVGVASGSGDPPPEVALTAYLLAQELVRHAHRCGATSVTVELCVEAERCTMGLTFDAPPPPDTTEERDRIGALNGEITMTPFADGAGSLITLVVPLVGREDFG